MAAPPPSQVGCRLHPFHSCERINFPDFSPIFNRHATPESAQGFHWSIDHIARLKPVDIATDPVNLLRTNGESPENEGEKEQLADTFFSQRSILPSPWPMSSRGRQGNLRQGLTPTLLPRSHLTPATAGRTKKVTFSPHPPSMAYISSDSIDSENKESALVNEEPIFSSVATQTAMTIPLGYNLHDILGPACVYKEDDGCAGGSSVRDLANTSLRRKLFGQPSRDGELDEDLEDEVSEERESKPHHPMAATPLRCSPGDCSHLSSTPLKSRHSHCPRHLLTSSPSPISPGILSSARPPACSSLVVTPGGNLPELSPIEEGGASGERLKVNCESCKRLFSLTPTSKVSSGPHLTPSPNCPPFSPILSHPHSNNVPTSSCGGPPQPPHLRAEPITMETPCQIINSPNQATSTPYRHGVNVRHQELVSGEGVEAEPVRAGDSNRPEREVMAERDSDDVPQPISLADLQTCEEELTSVTGVTTCTSYFTQLATEDSHSDRPQPLHSTVAVQNSNPLFHPTDPLRKTGHLRLPSIREISRINEPSIMGVTPSSDSGVAGSMDINQPHVASLSASREPGTSAAISLTEQERERAGLKSQKQAPTATKSETVDSGLVPSPDHAHNGHTHLRDNLIKTEVGVEFKFNPRPTSTPGEPSTHCCRTDRHTPSRYPATHLYRNKMGVPLLISQKFPTNFPPLCGILLPSQPKLLPLHQTPPSSKFTPSRLTGFSNWFDKSPGRSGSHTPLFPEEVIHRKEALKAQLQFCSPVRSRSPLSSSRRPLTDKLTLPSPVSARPFSHSPLPSSPVRHRTPLLLTQD